MKKTIYIYVNGILTLPGQSKNWNGKAVTWTHIHTTHKAENVEYFVGALGRAFKRGQQRRKAKLLKMMRYYADAGWDIVIVGHSNAANVIFNVLVEEGIGYVLQSIVGVQLFAPAAENDFTKNGMNDLGVPTTIYIGEKDTLLRVASGPGRLFGYGSLGKDGPKNADYEEVEVVKEPFGHSTWWDTTENEEGVSQFDRSMRAIHRPFGDRKVERFLAA